MCLLVFIDYCHVCFPRVWHLQSDFSRSLFEWGNNTHSLLLNCRGLFLKAVVVICTYLVRWRTEYRFKGLKSPFLIPSYRNSYKKNICIDMLRRGYHKSFSELFTLIQKWNALREAAGPGSAIWHEKSLEEQPDKLDQLYHFLTGAEAAQRAGKWGDCG